MKIIGVKGLSRVSRAASFTWSVSSTADSRAPVARLPIWSWLSWQTTNRQVGVRRVSIGVPCLRPRNDERVPSWKKPAVKTFARDSIDAKSA